MDQQETSALLRTHRAGGATAVRLGLVGCGRLAEFGYLPAIRSTAGFHLVGVTDVNPARCGAIAPDVPAYRTIQDLITAGSLDCLVISTPTRCHLSDARCATGAGLPTLLEKPPGVDVHEARALLGLIPSPWIAFNRRFEPSLMSLKSRLSKRKDLNLRLELHYRRASWRPFDMQDDALLDLGPHLIDLARWLTCGTIVQARASSLHDRRAEFDLDLDCGRATIICSTNSPYRELVVVKDGRGGEQHTHARGGLLAGVLARLRPTQENPLVTSLRGQLQAFGQAIRGDRTSTQLATAGDGVAVMSTIAAVRQSAMKGGSSCPVG